VSASSVGVEYSSVTNCNSSCSGIPSLSFVQEGTNTSKNISKRVLPMSAKLILDKNRLIPNNKLNIITATKIAKIINIS
jgi:hypothetical protein